MSTSNLNSALKVPAEKKPKAKWHIKNITSGALYPLPKYDVATHRRVTAILTTTLHLPGEVANAILPTPGLATMVKSTSSDRIYNNVAFRQIRRRLKGDGRKTEEFKVLPPVPTPEKRKPEAGWDEDDFERRYQQLRLLEEDMSRPSPQTIMDLGLLEMHSVRRINPEQLETTGLEYFLMSSEQKDAQCRKVRQLENRHFKQDHMLAKLRIWAVTVVLDMATLAHGGDANGPQDFVVKVIGKRRWGSPFF